MDRDDATTTDSTHESEEHESSTKTDSTESSSWLPHIKDVLGLLCEDDKVLNFGIYTVPAKFKSSSLNDDALCPRIVSIGHFHNGMPGLHAMHEQKLFYLSFLLHRTGDARKTFHDCCQAISDSDHFGVYARNFGYDSKSAENKLIEIMVIDGCFVLELLLRFSYRDMIDKDDVVLTNSWFAPILRHDLLLLQNQVPMFVLKILVEKIGRVSRGVSGCTSCRNNLSIDLTMEVFEELSCNFFRACVDKIVHGPIRGEKVFSRDRLHFLDMLHVAFAPPDDCNKDLGDHRAVRIGWEEKTPKLERCTQRLLAAGVKIVKAEGRHLLGLSFNKKTLKIPPLCVDLNTWSVLKNLVVLEQCGVERNHHVTSYAVVLRNLIRTARDVELLVHKGILEVDLDGGYDGVLAFVDCIGSGTVLRDFTYQTMFTELNAHRDPWWRWRKRKASWKLSWHKYKRILKNDYFPNPWRVVQIVVAFLLLALTALQTVYTVISNYK